MSYTSEFPRFTLDVDVTALTAAGFVDSSWHNDACPSWSFYPNGQDSAEAVQVFIAEADPAQREYPESARFLVQRIDENGAPADFLDSDDWSEAVTSALQSARSSTTSR